MAELRSGSEVVQRPAVTPVDEDVSRQSSAVEVAAAGEGRDYSYATVVDLEKVRTEMARMGKGLSGEIGRVRLEVAELRTDMVKMELRLWKRVDEKIDGLGRSMRTMLLVGFSFVSMLIALVAVLG